MLLRDGTISSTECVDGPIPMCTEQAANEAKMIQISAGGIVRPKMKKYRQLDARITDLKERLRQGMDVMEYADAASHLLHLD